MGSLGHVNRLEHERYECHSCNREYEDDEVRNTWKCPACADYVHVYAEDETGTRIVLLRKAAREVEKGDLVHLPGGLTGQSYMVLGINNRGAKLGLGLQEYGEFKIAPGEPVNIRTGAW